MNLRMGGKAFVTLRNEIEDINITCLEMNLEKNIIIIIVMITITSPERSKSRVFSERS